MRGTIAIAAGLATAVLIAVPAGAVLSSDIYITGEVMSRISGKNASTVRIAWDYKCLGEDGGNYEWTLKVIRTQPEPQTTTKLASGTGERGSKIAQLPAGRYLPTSNPYFCETRLGQGFDDPEIGAPFVVPDYCAWTISSVRGPVQHQHGISVKLARPGTSVGQGDTVATPKGGRAVLRATTGDGATTLEGGSQLTVDRKHCPARSGWKILLVEGGLVAAVPKSAAATASFMTTTGNATVSGRPGARWKVKYAKRRTMIHALSGTVLVAGKVLKPGQTAKI